AVIAVLDGQSPGAVDHPLRVALRKGEGGFEPVAIGFVDFAGLPKMSPLSVSLGLDGVKRLEFLLGFEGAATRTELHIVAPPPPAPPAAAVSPPRVPAGVHGFVALSIDLPGTYDQVVELLSRTNRPGGGGPDVAAVIEDRVRQEFGFGLRKDLIAGLGPKLT